MKRIALVFSMSVLALGCGDDGPTDDTPDANVEPDVMQVTGCPGSQDPSNPGFICPTSTARAWSFDDGAWVEQGPADFSCLNTPSTDTATTVDINIAGTVTDFQNNSAINAAQVELFAGVEFAAVLGDASTDETGAFTLSVPAGQERVGYKVAAANYLDTYTLNLYYEPETPDQNQGLNAVSMITANLVTALLDVIRTQGTGILAGSISDCSGRRISDVIATVSTTSRSHDHLEGARSYYFTGTATNSLPTSHSTSPQTSKDGLFVVIELPVSESAYLQVWGFTPDQDPTTDALTLLAEIPAPVVADSVIIASLRPLRQ
jgi:hypothetical protein